MGWVVFSYSMPSALPSGRRVAVWRRLHTLGAVAPKKGGVYVLPAREECIEAFQWLAQEVEQARGEALLMRVEHFEGLPDAQLVALMRQYEVDTILTRDSDFRRFRGIRVRDPFSDDVGP